MVLDASTKIYIPRKAALEEEAALRIFIRFSIFFCLMLMMVLLRKEGRKEWLSSFREGGGGALVFLLK